MVEGWNTGLIKGCHPYFNYIVKTIIAIIPTLRYPKIHPSNNPIGVRVKPQTCFFTPETRNELISQLIQEVQHET